MRLKIAEHIVQLNNTWVKDDLLPRQEFDELMDHIYEHGTAAEGVYERALKLCKAFSVKQGLRQS